MKTCPGILCLLIIGGIIFLGRAYADDPPDTSKQVIHARRITGEIKMTGKLDDPQWMLADPVPIEYEVTPGDNTPATVHTTARIVYNDQKIYFGFTCQDNHPSELRAHVTDRDKFFDDDFVMAIIDTYGDYKRAYEFVTNPYGIQGDLLRTGQNEDMSFDAVWESAAAID